MLISSGASSGSTNNHPEFSFHIDWQGSDADKRGFAACRSLEKIQANKL